MRNSIVAVNFADLYLLKRHAGAILEGLSHLWSEDQDATVTFRWTNDGWSAGVKSTNSNLFFGWKSPPEGVSAFDWTCLVSQELLNHLFSGSRFTLKEVIGQREPVEVEPRRLAFLLQRT